MGSAGEDTVLEARVNTGEKTDITKKINNKAIVLLMRVRQNF
jgi:hypothetical protein